MTEPFFFEDEAAAKDAASRLRKLGPRAIKLLSDCVEHQELTRQKASPLAESLSNEGFLFIRDNSCVFMNEVVYSPSLAGEEALELLEQENSTAPRKAGH